MYTPIQQLPAIRYASLICLAMMSAVPSYADDPDPTAFSPLISNILAGANSASASESMEKISADVPLAEPADANARFQGVVMRDRNHGAVVFIDGRRAYLTAPKHNTEKIRTGKEFQLNGVNYQIESFNRSVVRLKR